MVVSDADFGGVKEMEIGWPWAVPPFALYKYQVRHTRGTRHTTTRLSSSKSWKNSILLLLHHRKLYLALDFRSPIPSFVSLPCLIIWLVVLFYQCFTYMSLLEFMRGGTMCRVNVVHFDLCRTTLCGIHVYAFIYTCCHFYGFFAMLTVFDCVYLFWCYMFSKVERTCKINHAWHNRSITIIIVIQGTWFLFVLVLSYFYILY